MLEWQKDYQTWVELLRADYKDNAAQAAARTGDRQQRIEDLGKSLRDRENQWCPPPHRSRYGTPVPIKYFKQAACGCKTDCTCRPWSLINAHNIDLVPYEQWDLVQDVLSDTQTPASTWDEISSADARACLSLCRPSGHYVKKRQMRHRGPVESIMPHQSGSLMLRALTPDEDEARGMLGGIVAKDAFIKARFEMKETERHALPALLNWLQKRNPWLQAYAHSVKEIEPFKRLCEEGRLLSTGPFQPGDPRIETALENESIAMFLPGNDLKSSTGTYNHLRAAASKICTAQLRTCLPDAWQEVHASDLQNE